MKIWNGMMNRHETYPPGLPELAEEARHQYLILGDVKANPLQAILQRF